MSATIAKKYFTNKNGVIKKTHPSKPTIGGLSATATTGVPSAGIKAVQAYIETLISGDKVPGSTMTLCEEYRDRDRDNTKEEEEISYEQATELLEGSTSTSYANSAAYGLLMFLRNNY